MMRHFFMVVVFLVAVAPMLLVIVVMVLPEAEFALVCRQYNTAVIGCTQQDFERNTRTEPGILILRDDVPNPTILDETVFLGDDQSQVESDSYYYLSDNYGIVVWYHQHTRSIVKKKLLAFHHNDLQVKLQAFGHLACGLLSPGQGRIVSFTPLRHNERCGWNSNLEKDQAKKERGKGDADIFPHER